MDALDKGQVTQNAAVVYEKFFIPALFAQWPERVADAAQIQRGDRVLDVACGTGILARSVAERVGPHGTVAGLDINEGMLAVAAQKAPRLEWRQGRAEALPFDNGTFDAVVSQFGLMFFEDRVMALQEMVRVLRPGGRLAVAVWASLDDTPGYAMLVQLLHRLFGEGVANQLRFPFILGDVQGLRVLFERAGIRNAHLETHRGTARFPSIDAWMYTDVKGWVLADQIDDNQFQELIRKARQALAPFVISTGTVQFDAPAHIVSATKP